MGVIDMNIWHTMSEAEVLGKTGGCRTGLSADEAKRRLVQNGENALVEGDNKTALGIFLSQFNDLMIWVLIASALISAIVAREMIDAIIIMTVVLLNAVLGTIQEYRAESALKALHDLSAPSVLALRNSFPCRIPAKELVVGDIVLEAIYDLPTFPRSDNIFPYSPA